MLIRKLFALLVNESMPQDYKNLLIPQKENQNFIKNYENSRVEAKRKQERFLENGIFVHRASFDCR